jgi:segregation and condensation protein A
MDAPATADAQVTVPPGVESTLPDDAPRIHLPLFEGPLDLLLYLIRRDRIDIHDIPIAPITRRYMEYLELMKELNLDVAGELPRARRKASIPARSWSSDSWSSSATRKPRASCIRKGRSVLRRGPGPKPCYRLSTMLGEEIFEAGLFDLISAFKELLDRRKTLLAHEVTREGKSIEQRIGELLDLIKEGASIEFLELFAAEESKPGMIVTFLALLELIRLKQVKVYQRGLFGPIRVFRPVGPEAGAPQPAA